MQMDESFVREPEVRHTLGLGGPRSTYDQVDDGLLPPPVKVGRQTVAWPRSEIRHLVAARIAGKNNDEIRTLVQAMIKRRAKALRGFEVPA
jgi:prophage regulatory protein